MTDAVLPITGRCHGPWGKENREANLDVKIPAGVTECVVSWRSWAIYTRDGESDRLFIDGNMVWQKKARHSGCRDGWQTGPSDFPHSSKQHPSCYVDASVKVPCSGTMKLKFTSGVDQAMNDEAWAFSDLIVHAATAVKAIYAEIGADGHGWSVSKVTNAGSAGLVHGPYGSEAKVVKKSIPIPAYVSTCIVTWRSWTIDSRDNEADRLLIDGHKIWEHKAVFPSGAGGCEKHKMHSGPPDFPNPWAGQRAGDVCFVDVSVTVPCASTLRLMFESDINQPLSDEGWAFSQLAIYPGESMGIVYQEDEAETTGWYPKPLAAKVTTAGSAGE